MTNDVALYLMSSYLYYELNVAVISDPEFDVLCKRLLDNYDNIEHMHKHLVLKENLVAGTCLGIEYPLMVKHAAIEWYKKGTGNDLHVK